ncbi:MAG: hypothetical protein CL916_05635, partial [Deltaproteobacteria bacterium]|nr:hypothetical protein [Deltaproteobacteria bacterium]
IEHDPSPSVPLDIKVIVKATHTINGDKLGSPVLVDNVVLPASQQHGSQVTVSGTYDYDFLLNSTIVYGKYSIDIELSSNSALNYSSSSAGGLFIELITPEQAELEPPPQLSSAVFASNGSSVLLEFDTVTNYGGGNYSKGSSFNCALLLFFPDSDSEQYSCRWIEADILRIIVSGSSSSSSSSTNGLVKGSIIKISNNTQLILRRRCTENGSSGNNCKFFEPTTDDSKSVAVQVPEIIDPPVVNIDIPIQLGLCDTLKVSLQGSTGDGGRYWQSIEVTIFSKQRHRVVIPDEYIETLKERLSVDIPMNQMNLTPNEYYNFEVKLENFLGGSNTNNKLFYVIDDTAYQIPQVTISSPKKLIVKKDNTIDMIGDVSIHQCDGSLIKSGISVEWLIKRNEVTEFFSYSANDKNPLHMLLDASELQTNAKYSFELIATNRNGDSNLTLPGIASVMVYTVESPPVIVIIGGSDYILRPEGTLSIDSTQSYDPDVTHGSYGHFGNSPKELSWEWKCVRSFGDKVMMELLYDVDIIEYPCFPFTYNMSTSTNQIFTLKYPINISNMKTAGLTTTIQLVVYKAGSDKESRISTKQYIRVHALDSVAPTIMLKSSSNIIGSSRSFHRFNVNNRLVLEASVEYAHDTIVQWTPTPQLRDDIKIPMTINGASVRLLAPRRSKSKRIVNFVLDPLSLEPDILYTFRLSASLNSSVGESSSDGVITSVASVEVYTNGAPSPGFFDVTPNRGVEINDVFKFNAKHWEDLDLPLKYLFGFTSGNITMPATYLTINENSKSKRSSDRVQIISKMSSDAFYESILPVGQLTAVARIFDAYHAYTDATTNLEVTALPAIDEVERVEKIFEFVETAITTSGQSRSLLITTEDAEKNHNGNADGALQINTALKLVNTLASSLNIDVHTKVDESITFSGSDFNIGSHADGENDIFPGDIASPTDASGVSNTHKSCPNNCAVRENGVTIDRGMCAAINAADGYDYYDEQHEIVKVCLYSQIDCEMVCRCEVGYGGRGCTKKLIVHTQKEKIREILLDALLNTTFYDVLSADETVINTRLNSLLSVAQVHDELTERSASAIKSIASNSLDTIVVMQLSATNVEMVLQAYSTLLDKQLLNFATNQFNSSSSGSSGGNSSDKRRHLQSNINRGKSLVSVDDMNTLMKQVTGYFAQSIVPGELVKKFYSRHYSMELASPDPQSLDTVDTPNCKDNIDDQKNFNLTYSSLVSGVTGDVTLLNVSYANLRMSVREVASYLYESHDKYSINEETEVGGKKERETYWSVSSNGSRYDSNPLHLSLFDNSNATSDPLDLFQCNSLSSNNSSGRKMMNITLPRRSTSGGARSIDMLDEMISISCSTSPENRTVTCKNGYSTVVPCNGTRAILQISCPSVEVNFNCTFPGSNTTVNGCKFVSNNEEEVRCQCDICDALNSGYIDSNRIRRRLGIDISVRDVEFVAMASHVWTDFGLNVIAIGDQGNLQFYTNAGFTTAFFGVVVGIIFLVLVGAESYHALNRHLIDKKMKKIKADELEAKFGSRAGNTPISGNAINGHLGNRGGHFQMTQRQFTQKIPRHMIGDFDNEDDHVHDNSNSAGRASDELSDNDPIWKLNYRKTLDKREKMIDFVRSFFPGTFSTDNTHLRFLREINNSHILYSVLSHKFSLWERLIICLRLLGTIVISAFLLALYLDLQYPSDDGQCLSQLTQEACNSIKSMFDEETSKCEWIEGIDGESFDRCSWVEPKFSIFIIGYIVVMVMLVSVPLNYFFDVIFEEILGAPTPANVNKKLQYAEMGKRFVQGMAAAVGSIKGSMTSAIRGVGGGSEISSEHEDNKTSSSMRAKRKAMFQQVTKQLSQLRFTG